MPFQINFNEQLEASRTSLIFVKNKFGVSYTFYFHKPLKDVKAKISLNFIVSPEEDFRPKCDTFRMLSLVHSLEWIRFGQLCRPDRHFLQIAHHSIFGLIVDNVSADRASFNREMLKLNNAVRVRHGRGKS